MKEEKLKGHIEEICEELKREKKRCGNMLVCDWIELRHLETTVCKQLNIDVKEIR